MRIMLNGAFSSNEFITLKDKNWLEKQRVAGKVVAGALSLLEAEVKKGTQLSLIELNILAEQFILNNDCELTFKNYKGFPAGICISVDKQLVHGIPTDYHLQDGDLVSFDLGATYKGAIADSALTCIYGIPKSEDHVRLVRATEESLIKGIAAIKVGNRLGCIGNAISKCAKGYGYGIITKYGGHGLEWNEPHVAPFINNKSTVNEGIRIQSGLSIAIEPLLVMGNSTETYLEKDKWGVLCDNVCCHFEHSVYIHDDYVEVVT